MKVKTKYPVIGKLGDSKIAYVGLKNDIDMVLVNGKVIPLGSLLAHGHGLELDKNALLKARK